MMKIEGHYVSDVQIMLQMDGTDKWGIFQLWGIFAISDCACYCMLLSLKCFLCHCVPVMAVRSSKTYTAFRFPCFKASKTNSALYAEEHIQMKMIALQFLPQKTVLLEFNAFSMPVIFLRSYTSTGSGQVHQYQMLKHPQHEARDVYYLSYITVLLCYRSKLFSRALGTTTQ